MPRKALAGPASEPRIHGKSRRRSHAAMNAGAPVLKNTPAYVMRGIVFALEEQRGGDAPGRVHRWPCVPKAAEFNLR